MKNVITFLLVFGLWGGVAVAGGITDDNDGAVGNVFVSTGENNGANSVGTWTDSSFLQGADGINGINGVNGVDGVNGVNGADGMGGINGANGSDGVNGAIGATGTNGKDVDPALASAFQNYMNTNSGQVNNLNSRVDRLEEMKVLIEPEIRLLDTKKTTVKVFGSYDVRHGSAFAVGVRLTYKLGQSYEEKLIEEMNTKLDALIAQKVAANEKVVGKTTNGLDLVSDGQSIRVNGKF